MLVADRLASRHQFCQPDKNWHRLQSARQPRRRICFSFWRLTSIAESLSSRVHKSVGSRLASLGILRVCFPRWWWPIRCWSSLVVVVCWVNSHAPCLSSGEDAACLAWRFVVIILVLVLGLAIKITLRREVVDFGIFSFLLLISRLRLGVSSGVYFSNGIWRYEEVFLSMVAGYGGVTGVPPDRTY